MHWIEQFFGFSPDGGDGRTEAMLALAAFMVLAIVLYLRGHKLKAYVRNLRA
jgi:hypothetical protein